jgi:hypothetical protein
MTRENLPGDRGMLSAMTTRRSPSFPLPTKNRPSKKRPVAKNAKASMSVSFRSKWWICKKGLSAGKNPVVCLRVGQKNGGPG